VVIPRATLSTALAAWPRELTDRFSSRDLGNRNANGQSHVGAFNAESSNGASDGSSVAQNAMKQKTPTGQENLQS
jgi:hypothetical protein